MCPQPNLNLLAIFILLIKCNNPTTGCFPRWPHYPNLRISHLSLSSLSCFPISLQVIVLSRRIKPYPAKNDACGSGDLTDRRNYRDEGSDGSRPPPPCNYWQPWREEGASRLHRGIVGVCDEIIPRSSTLMIREVLSSSYHQY